MVDDQQRIARLNSRLGDFLSYGETFSKALGVRNDLAAIGCDVGLLDDWLRDHLARRTIERVSEAVQFEEQPPEPTEVHVIQFDQPLRFARRDFERLYLEGLLQRCRGNIARAAKLSGLDRSALSRKLAQLGIDRTRSRPKLTQKRNA